MTSQDMQRQTSVHSEPDAESEYTRERRRQANVYDAVAGRVSTSQPVRLSPHSARLTSAGSYQQRDAVLAPEEVLFSRKDAPQRYAEKDIYFAHEALPDGGRRVLPGSDLLKAVHGYASRFYEAMGRRHDQHGGQDYDDESSGRSRSRSIGGEDNRHSRNPCFVGSRLIDERSMDETALLAFGILLEEAAREALGKRGDLVFTEGLALGNEAEIHDGQSNPEVPRQEAETVVGFLSEQESWKRRMPKRRKLVDARES